MWLPATPLVNMCWAILLNIGCVHCVPVVVGPVWPSQLLEYETSVSYSSSWQTIWVDPIPSTFVSWGLTVLRLCLASRHQEVIQKLLHWQCNTCVKCIFFFNDKHWLIINKCNNLRWIFHMYVFYMRFVFATISNAWEFLGKSIFSVSFEPMSYRVPVHMKYVTVWIESIDREHFEWRNYPGQDNLEIIPINAEPCTPETALMP